METKRLNSYQQTSYWWINTLKSKMEELFLYKQRTGTLDDEGKLEFLHTFETFSDKDWRAIYLELKKYIEKDVSEYTPSPNFTSFNMDAFSQDTAKGEHNRLNDELIKILGTTIPDICLAPLGRKDSVIYTDSKAAYVWYKSCGMQELPKEYASRYNYIITGNKKELEFYNLILSTIIAIKGKNESFNSMDDIRNLFCEEYKKINNLDIPLKQLLNNLNEVFNVFYRRELYISKPWDNEFYFKPRKIDSNGLNGYELLADYYSNAILGIDNNEELTNRVKALSLKKKK